MRFTYTATILMLYLAETYLRFLHNSYLHRLCVPGILGSASCAFFLPAVLSVVGGGQCPAEMEENRHYLSPPPKISPDSFIQILYSIIKIPDSLIFQTRQRQGYSQNPWAGWGFQLSG